jgi:hypothetical protein
VAREVDEFREHEDGEGEVVKAGAAVEIYSPPGKKQ